MNFSEKMNELDKILKKLEGDAVPLEEALAEFERGIGLVRECKTFLDEARQRVKILTDMKEVPLELSESSKGENNGQTRD